MGRRGNPHRKGAILYKKFVRLLKQIGFREDSFLILLAILIGVMTGLGSVVFIKLIDFSHNVFFGKEGLYSSGAHLYLLVAIPCIGALLVGLITYIFARETRGEGIPQVMDAIARKDGKIRPRVAIVKAITSALTIGSGGAAGFEGPIIQIGASIGSGAGQFFQIAKYHMPVLVGCGAAAGISAIFHAPIAGVLFALEVFLRDLNFKTFSPVLIASVISSVVVSAILENDEALFPIVDPTAYHFQWFELPNYVILGLLAASAAIIFIKTLYGMEDFFEKIKVHHILKPVIGAAALGLLGLFSVLVLGDNPSGEPTVFAYSYGFIGRCIGANVHEAGGTFPITIWILLAFLVLKILATSFTLGSGGSGGTFAPILFIGAVVGYAFALILKSTGIFPDISIATYALVGMASVLSATIHAPMVAIVLLFEITRNYEIILPVMFAATVALAISQLMFKDSIYSLKLRRDGVHYETFTDTAILRRLSVSMVMQPQVESIYDDMPLQEVINLAVEREVADFVVVDHAEHYYGLLVGPDLRAALLQPESVPFLVAGELARTDAPVVSPSESLDQVLDKFSRLDVNCIAVHNQYNENEFIGLITRADLMRRYQQELLHHT